MKYSLNFSLIVLSALAAAPLAAKGPLTVEHLNQFNKISALSLSADGRYMAYSQTNGGFSPADTSSDIYLKDLKQSNPAQRLTQTDASERALAFSHDGRALYFIANRSGSNQIWRLPLSGGEALQLTDLPLPVEGFKVAADGKTLALSLSVLPGCNTLKCTVDAKAAEKERKDSALAYDSLMVRHWDHWRTPYRSQLHVAAITVAAEGAGNRVVTDAKNLISDWDTDIAGMDQVSFTPDNQHVVFSAKRRARIRPGILTMIFFR
jgi:dipeptidyl aminopeptidase/acylaminoacyl peptidase